MFKVLKQFSRLVEAIEALETVLTEQVAVQREAGPALDRLEALELSRHQFEAECHGKLLQADGKFKAANNAEARERQLKRSYERLAVELDPDLAPSTAPGDPVPEGDADRGEAERLQAMRLVVAPNDKAFALRAKWSA